ncbi:MAG: DUF1576 domain-containing protein [Lachnospiraceae bacterium]|nr:DUF1576 domain-containing protein [Lachnospiraceae bacterium]
MLFRSFMTDYEENPGRIVWGILCSFTTAFFAGALAAGIYTGQLEQIIPGFLTICSRPSQFTMDYFELGTLGGAFLNTAMVALACVLMLKVSQAKCNGLTVAAYWLTVGFATFGMTFTNIWPFFFGTWIYSKIKKVKFSTVANLAMFSTALAPFASELMVRYPGLEAHGFTVAGVLGAILLGIFVGCVMPPLIAHIPTFHLGFDLYSAGPAAGFLAFLLYCVLYRSPGIEVPTNTHLGEGYKAFVNVFFFLVFALCIFTGISMDKGSLRRYTKLLKHHGHKTDFTTEFGIPVTLINMGMYGFFILLYYNAVHGFVFADGAVTFTAAKFTGATMGAIMCMFAFVAQGAQPATVFPVAVGYALASLLPFGAAYFGLVETQNWNLCTQAILVGMCFASGLAPISGKYGFFAGVAAGAIHATLVMSVPLWHGGFCLYNGGFTDGVVAFLLVPVLDRFYGTYEERMEKRKAG